MPAVKANRTFIVSRWPLEQDGLALPDFDQQFPANIQAVRLPAFGLHVLGLRVPAYGSKQSALLLKSWEWIEAAAVQLREMPAVILGDLNIRVPNSRGPSAASFRRILASGWQRAVPADDHSYFGPSGAGTEIDHVLATPRCKACSAKYVTAVPDFTLARSPGTLSDHATLVAELDIGHDPDSSKQNQSSQPRGRQPVGPR